MNNLIKATCLVIYVLGLASTFGLLPPALSILGPIAAILLGAHALEAVLMFKYVKRYPGGVAASLVLTLLFGLAHWLPLRKLPAPAQPDVQQ